MNRDAMIHKMNESGGSKQPFIFLIDFEMEDSLFFSLDKLNRDELLFDFNGMTNSPDKKDTPVMSFSFIKSPLDYVDYLNKFNFVMQHLSYGNSYLVNLTVPTPIETTLSLKEIFYRSQAKYKLLYEEKFVCFSPEKFVQINKEGIISSFPMKGTIDAAIENAEEMIMQDAKEYAEHCTIVDLIRNDLGMVAKNVHVNRFRYIDRIKTHEKELLQVSSQICGELGKDYAAHLGDIIFTLLPAGSVSGAPKKKTVEIIKEAEDSKRGFYTGVCGMFNGEKLDSGVMIRFIENKEGKLYYRSGGGVTVYSTAETEYMEMIDKVYVPVV
jgi:para-aminobenzoate synthetase component I